MNLKQIIRFKCILSSSHCKYLPEQVRKPLWSFASWRSARSWTRRCRPCGLPRWCSTLATTPCKPGQCFQKLILLFKFILSSFCSVYLFFKFFKLACNHFLKSRIFTTQFSSESGFKITSLNSRHNMYPLTTFLSGYFYSNCFIYMTRKS